MLLPVTKLTYWTTVINFLVQNYFTEWITICIVKSKQLPFELEITNTNNRLHQYIIIDLEDLVDSFENNSYDFQAKKEDFEMNDLNCNELCLKLTVSIESSYCEAFVIFQEVIPDFLEIYLNASLFTDWESTRNHFLFVYSKDLLRGKNFLHHWFFKDQGRLLIVKTELSNSSIFDLKTNQFIGSKYEPAKFYLLNQFNATSGALTGPNADLYPNKMKNLEGREVYLGAFDYRPFVAVDYEREPNLIDRTSENPKGKVRIDGIEVRVLYTFCEIYNCTVIADTTKGDWGNVYQNMSGCGFRLKLAKREVDMTLGANYYWIQPYIDRSCYIGFSQMTMLVPRPQADISWTLPLRPFKFDLWLGVVGYIIIEAISLLFTREIENTIEHHGKHNWRESLKYGFTTALKLFISQSSQYVVKSISLRTLLFACYMNDIIVTSIYGGGLASVLTLPTLGEAPDTLERFVAFNVKWADPSTIWTESYITADKGSIEDKLVSLYRPHEPKDFLKLAQTGEYGFVLERTMYGHFGNLHFENSEPLDYLKLMIEEMTTAYTVCFVPRGWAMTEQLNEFIMNWHTGGFGQFWEWKVVAEYLNVNIQGRIALSKNLISDSGPVKLDISHFAGGMVVLIVGLILSTLIFIFEHLQAKYKILNYCDKNKSQLSKTI